MDYRSVARGCCGSTPSCGVRDSPKPLQVPPSTPPVPLWTRTVSPEKATGSQETAPSPDHSQEVSAAQSQVQLFGTAHPQPSPEARSGAGRPGWFISSHIVFQTMGKVPLNTSPPGVQHRLNSVFTNVEGDGRNTAYICLHKQNTVCS
uniref:Uncharacterized protein n=1 Tax=Moschus moschiferus TaxID=68415 RepID=A0A8C6ECV2_MOSMO